MRTEAERTHDNCSAGGGGIVFALGVLATVVFAADSAAFHGQATRLAARYRGTQSQR